MKMRTGLIVMLILISAAVSRSFGQTGSKAEAAMAQLMEGNFQQAKIIANEVLNSDKNSGMAYAARAGSFYFNNDWKSAQADLEKALKLSPDNGLYLAMLADVYDAQNNEVLAKKTSDRAIVALRSPQSANDYFARGLTYSFLKKSQEAMADYGKAIQLSPRHARAYAKRGMISFNNSQYDAAYADFTKCIEINPQYSSPWFYRGNALLQKRNYEKAVADYNKCISLVPDFADAYFNRAVCYKQLQKYDLALADYDKSLSLNPKDWDAYNNKGHVFFMQAKYDQALKEYNKSIDLNARNASSWLFRGNTYRRLKDDEKALPDYNTALGLNPKYIDALTERGTLFYNNKMYDDAMADYNKLVQIDPKYSQGYHNIAIVYHDKQQFGEAIKNYDKALELDPKNTYVYYNRADAYESIGNARQAKEDRKQFVALGGKLNPTGAKTYKELFPSTSFDVKMAKDALSGGTCTIRGRACTRVDGGIFDARGVKVVLFPVTPYLEDWYDMREKKEKKDVGVFMSVEANKYRIETSADSDGRFIFTNLKPGRYFIQIIHSFNQAKTARVYTGQDVSQNGPVRQITNYYYDQNYTVGRSKRLEKFVELKDDGDTRKVTMTNGLIKSCTL